MVSGYLHVMEGKGKVVIQSLFMVQFTNYVYFLPRVYNEERVSNAP